MSLKTIKVDILKRLERPERTNGEKVRFRAPEMLVNLCNIVLQVKN